MADRTINNCPEDLAGKHDIERKARTIELGRKDRYDSWIEFCTGCKTQINKGVTPVEHGN